MFANHSPIDGSELSPVEATDPDDVASKVAAARDAQQAWADTPLGHLHAGDQMYFIHSFQARPVDPATGLAWSEYGDEPFCAALSCGNLLAFQFHPERSGPLGLGIYAELASRIASPDRLHGVGRSTATV